MSPVAIIAVATRVQSLGQAGPGKACESLEMKCDDSLWGLWGAFPLTLMHIMFGSSPLERMT